MPKSSEPAAINAVGSVEPAAPSYTVLWDWVWMSAAPDQAKIYYWALRSFIHEKNRQHVVEVTDDEIAELTGRSGKAVGRARKSAEEHGLVAVLEERRRHGWTNGIKHSLPVLRQIRVQIQPPEGYTGWTNPFEARADVRARQDGRTDLSNHADQATVDIQSPEASTRWDGWTDLSSRRTDLSSRRTDLSTDAPPDQGKSGSQVTPQVNPQPTSARARAGAGWLEGQQDNDGEDASSSPDSRLSGNPDGVRILRSLPRGVGGALTSAAVSQWSHVVGEALQSGMSEQVITDKLTSDLPDDDRAKRVRIVVGRRLPDLQATIAEPVQHRQCSPSEVARAKVDRLAERGEHGAREAAGLLGEFWDPEQHRGDVGAREWKLEILPELSRKFVEQRRDALIKVLTSRNDA